MSHCSNLLDLPPEVLCSILSMLPRRTLTNVSLTCNQIREFVTELFAEKSIAVSYRGGFINSVPEMFKKQTNFDSNISSSIVCSVRIIRKLTITIFPRDPIGELEIEQRNWVPETVFLQHLKDHHNGQINKICLTFKCERDGTFSIGKSHLRQYERFLSDLASVCTDVTSLFLTVNPLVFQADIFSDFFSQIRRLNELGLAVSWPKIKDGWQWSLLQHFYRAWSFLQRGQAGYEHTFTPILDLIKANSRSLDSLSIDLCCENQTGKSLTDLMNRDTLRRAAGYLSTMLDDKDNWSLQPARRHTWPAKLNLKKIKCLNFPPIIHEAVSEAFRLSGMGHLEHISIFNCDFGVSTSGIWNNTNLHEVKHLQILHHHNEMSLRYAIHRDRFKSLETLAIVSAYEMGPLQFTGENNIKSCWWEYPYDNHRRLYMNWTWDFDRWSRLEELAITMTTGRIHRYNFGVPSSLKKLCFIQTAAEVRCRRNPGRYCERLLAKYAKGQMQRTGELPNLRVMAIGVESACTCFFRQNRANKGRVKIEARDLSIVVARHEIVEVGKIRKRQKLQTKYESIDLEDAWERFPDSHVLGRNSGPWGWFRS
ncbi:hypothetical protein TWF694_011093 [Orbilia ellipsospora]|uniref:F-box domain-containing protein n=1 Tax=Orbilia ellipsospora TaxID=2528407 RepID=A0AAV9X955_9PEZI